MKKVLKPEWLSDQLVTTVNSFTQLPAWMQREARLEDYQSFPYPLTPAPTEGLPVQNSEKKKQ